MELFQGVERMVGMGEVRAKVRIENNYDRMRSGSGLLAEEDVRVQEIEAVVDTGAVLMLLPQELVEALGLQLMDKVIVALADERRIELARAGGFSVTIAGRTTQTICLVGPPGCEPLLGQVVLEELDLIVDPLQRKVTPRPESPFLPTLKLKRSAKITKGGTACSRELSPGVERMMAWNQEPRSPLL